MQKSSGRLAQGLVQGEEARHLRVELLLALLAADARRAGRKVPPPTTPAPWMTPWSGPKRCSACASAARIARRPPRRRSPARPRRPSPRAPAPARCAGSIGSTSPWVRAPLVPRRPLGHPGTAGEHEPRLAGVSERGGEHEGHTAQAARDQVDARLRADAAGRPSGSGRLTRLEALDEALAAAEGHHAPRRVGAQLAASEARDDGSGGLERRLVERRSRAASGCAAPAGSTLRRPSSVAFSGSISSSRSTACSWVVSTLSCSGLGPLGLDQGLRRGTGGCSTRSLGARAIVSADSASARGAPAAKAWTMRPIVRPWSPSARSSRS